MFPAKWKNFTFILGSFPILVAEVTNDSQDDSNDHGNDDGDNEDDDKIQNSSSQNIISNFQNTFTVTNFIAHKTGVKSFKWWSY